MSKEVWTTIIAQIVAIATTVIGIWVLPEYRDLALVIVASVEAIALALVAQFYGERLAALEAAIRSRH